MLRRGKRGWNTHVFVNPTRRPGSERLNEKPCTRSLRTAWTYASGSARITRLAKSSASALRRAAGTLKYGELWYQAYSCGVGRWETGCVGHSGRSSAGSLTFEQFTNT